MLGSTLRSLVPAGSCCRAPDSVLATNKAYLEPTGQVSGLSESKTRTLEGIAFQPESHPARSSTMQSEQERNSLSKPARFRNTLERPPTSRYSRRKRNRAARVCGFTSLFDIAEGIFGTAVREPDQGGTYSKIPTFTSTPPVLTSRISRVCLSSRRSACFEILIRKNTKARENAL